LGFNFGHRAIKVGYGAHLDLASIGQYEAGLRNLDRLLRIPES
jgi:hypothetical protein